MHIVIATSGTRGDVQPYVALGKALRDRGHTVTVATHVDHGSLVADQGLRFRGICGSFSDLMRTPEGVRWLESSDRPRAYLRAFRELFAPLAEDWLRQFDEALEDADAVLVHSFAMAAVIALERRSTPRVVLSPFAAVPSARLDLGLIPVPLIAGHLERLAFGFFYDRSWAVTKAGAASFRRAHRLPRPRRSPWRELIARGVGHLHLFSEHVAPRPGDWPACAEVTGYCFLDAAEAWTPPPDLLDFLSAGSPPVYVGFGSMTGMEPAALAAITRDALRAGGQRAVVCMGWGGLAGFDRADDFLVVHDVPHDWLFPRVAAVVHHGGAGTTAAAVRAGKPSVITPFFGDQPYWGRRLFRLGVGPAPIAKRKLAASSLAAAITEAVSTPAFAERAAALGAKVREERGAARAAERALYYFERQS